MNLYLKSLSTFIRDNWILLLILLAATFIRFYNFENRVIYGPEQAMSLTVSARYLSEKFSLLGQQYFRETTDAHRLFSGALFNYSLIPLQLLFKYDPIKITYYFGFLNLITGILTYILAKKLFGSITALISAFLFLFNSYMVYHSLFLWNYNYLPIIGIVTFYLLAGNIKKPNILNEFFLGVFAGLGFSLQFLYAFAVLVTFLIIIFKSPHRVKTIVCFFAGAFIGNFPMWIFDLRHNFYHVKSLLSFLFLNGYQQDHFSLQYYHFLYIWPVVAVLVAFFCRKYLNKTVLTIFFILYLYINFSSPLVNLQSTAGMPEGLKANDIILAAGYISESEKHGNFNVAQTYDFDTRASVLRYPLEFIYLKKPLDYKQYKDPERLYVLSEIGYDYLNPVPWEIKEYIPYTQNLVYKINDKWGLFELKK